MNIEVVKSNRRKKKNKTKLLVIKTRAKLAHYLLLIVLVGFRKMYPLFSRARIELFIHN